MEKTGEEAVSKVGTVYTLGFTAGIASATTKSVPVPAQFIANYAYTAGSLVKKDLEIYAVKATYTSGTAFNPDDFMMVRTPELPLPCCFVSTTKPDLVFETFSIAVWASILTPSSRKL